MAAPPGAPAREGDEAGASRGGPTTTEEVAPEDVVRARNSGACEGGGAGQGHTRSSRGGGGGGSRGRPREPSVAAPRDAPRRGGPGALDGRLQTDREEHAGKGPEQEGGVEPPERS